MSWEDITTLQKSLFEHKFLLHSRLLFVAKKWRLFRQQNSPRKLDVIPLNNVDSFFLQDNATLRLESLQKQLYFHDLNYVFKHWQDIFFSVLAYKIWRSIVRLFFSIFFRIFFDLFMIWIASYSILKAFIMFFIDRIYCCFFVYDPTRFRFILWHL